MNKNNCLKRLIRRCEYLKRRVEERDKGDKGGAGLDFDKSEAAALEWAIDFIENHSAKTMGQTK